MSNTRWVITSAVASHGAGGHKIYPALWHLQDDPPHKTEYLLGWNARNASASSRFARMSWRMDKETRHPVSVCPACLFSTQLSEGMARYG